MGGEGLESTFDAVALRLVAYKNVPLVPAVFCPPPAGAPGPGNPPVTFSYMITQRETTLQSPPTWSIGDEILVELASNARASITIAADVYSPEYAALVGCAETFVFTPCGESTMFSEVGAQVRSGFSVQATNKELRRD